MATPYDIARGLIGQHEGPEQTLLNKFLSGNTSGMTSDQFAWCSRFVKQAALKAGVDPKSLTGANDMARSWLKVGQEAKVPQQGDIAVLPRGDPKGPYGHVGFYAGEGDKPGTVKVLAGNQGDSVSYASYPSDQVLGYRRLGQDAPASGAFSGEGQPPPVLQAGFGRESGPSQPTPMTPPMQVASAPEVLPWAKTSPTPEGGLSGAFKGITSNPVGTLTKGIGAFGEAFGGGGQNEDALKQLANMQQGAESANASALQEEEQRQIAALKSVLSRRQRHPAFA